MAGIIILYAVLAAWFGGIVLASAGALKAVAAGEKWNWAKFGVSIIIALIAGASYYGIVAAADPNVGAWYICFAAFCWGATLETAQSQLTGLIVKAKA